MKRISLLLGFGILAASVAFACNNPTSSSAAVQNQVAQSRALPVDSATFQTIAMLQQQAKPDEGTTPPTQSSPPVTNQTPAAPNPPSTGATPPPTQANPPTSQVGTRPANNTGTAENGSQNNQGVNNPGTTTSPNAASGNSQQPSANDQNKPLYERQATDLPWANSSAGNSNTPPPPH